MIWSNLLLERWLTAHRQDLLREMTLTKELQEHATRYPVGIEERASRNSSAFWPLTALCIIILKQARGTVRATMNPGVECLLLRDGIHPHPVLIAAYHLMCRGSSAHPQTHMTTTTTTREKRRS